ncbi:MAG: hypothetical protein WD628_03005, partial [Thermomicrobiales bacterium]
LDECRAAAAAARFVGAHAFGTFAGSGRSQSLCVEQLVRNISLCEWNTRAGCGRHELRVVANGFLPQMVRNIVGATVRVAAGEHEPAWIDDLIAANDRRVLGEAAPSQGLVLWRVRYEADDDERREAVNARPWPGEEYEED